jgi:hypothetical protein
MSDHEHRDERTDDLGAVVGFELVRRVDDLHRPALTLGDVRRRAHRIRRNRRAGALAAVAAVVAAIVLPVSLLGGPDRADRIEPAPSPGRADPGASVLNEGDVTSPDGRTVTVGLDTTDVSAFGVLADGRVVAALSSEGLVRVYSAEGDPTGDHPVGTVTLRMSPDDSAAAWVDPEGRVQVLESGSAEPVELARLPRPDRSAWSVVSVLGTGCAAGGCEVLAPRPTTS